MRIYRVYIEKKDGFDGDSRRLREELRELLGRQYPAAARLRRVRILRRYDVEFPEGASPEGASGEDRDFDRMVAAVLAEPVCDTVLREPPPPPAGEDAGPELRFAVEYLPGQYDQRADQAAQCAMLLGLSRPVVRTARVYLLEFSPAAPPTPELAARIKKFLVNPVDSREVVVTAPPSPQAGSGPAGAPEKVPEVKNFRAASREDLAALAGAWGLAMSLEDLAFAQAAFVREGRDPTLTELRILDTYWSDHCRHTTFTTALDFVPPPEGAGGKTPLGKAFALYEAARRETGREAAPQSLMDLATIGLRVLRARGLAEDVDESKEINACTVRIAAGGEQWLLLFKNETHNHPTEIEPFGGAATCLGGAIRDPLAGRAYVYQALRVSGGADPRTPLEKTLPGKLPPVTIAREAAAGFSSYGNQIGLATGQVAEFYHPGFLAKRLELGAVVGAVPADWVRREEPLPGDLVILVGGRTGRDGIGGATGSSKVHTGESVEKSGAEVQKGNPVEERKLQRLFRRREAVGLIKRCNDFGAGGVAVAVGELAAGLDIDLDAVPKKYASLDGTELAISESQERMAVVTAPSDAARFIALAAEENLEATVIARVTAGDAGTAGAAPGGARLRMTWRGDTIVDLPRAFLDTNGAPRSATALLAAAPPPAPPSPAAAPGLPGDAGACLQNLAAELASPRSGSRRGLQERFDGSIGAASVLFPWGGATQGTPECGMAALIPVPPAAATEEAAGGTEGSGPEAPGVAAVAPGSAAASPPPTASLMTFGYDIEGLEKDPYQGAKGSVKEALARFACLGGDFRRARLSFQEYFPRPATPESWGRPAAALLGALEAQLRLGVPAIGGKDSMSGGFDDSAHGIHLAVPPTLVAFAAGVVPADRVRSGALTPSRGDGDDLVLLLDPAAFETGTGDEWDAFAACLDALATIARAGAVKAAYPVPPGGVAAGLALMAFGSMTSLELLPPAYSRETRGYPGAVLVQTGAAGAALAGEPGVVVARLLPAGPDGEGGAGAGAVLKAGTAEVSLAALRDAYEQTFAGVYPPVSTAPALTRLPETPEPPARSPREPAPAPAVLSRNARRPLVVIPVFPGTNCEWDTARAFQEAGARVRQLVFRNRTGDDVRESLAALARSLRDAQILALAGGFSAGDEPDGSGKFIANVLRSPEVAEALMEDFLGSRDGLILGICNGFQALIKTGLVPYGRLLTEAERETAPTLTFNALGRHVSRMVRTRVMSTRSPWLAREEPGALHVLPVSHGEGRVYGSPALLEKLFAAGQVPFCYAGPRGEPAGTEPDNPALSAWAIEGLTSPDGRVLGKMAHSERRGPWVHVNIPGNKNQRIFEAGVAYYDAR